MLGGLPPLASEPGSAQASHAVGFECVLPTEEFFHGESVPPWPSGAEHTL
jgi:hypothetical protein